MRATTAVEEEEERLSDKSSPWKTSEVFILHNESLTGRKSKKQDGVDAQKVKQVTEDHLQRGRHLKGTVHPKKIIHSLSTHPEFLDLPCKTVS